MKQIRLHSLRSLFFLCCLSFSVMVWAQENTNENTGNSETKTTTTTTKTTDIDVTAGSDQTWYTQPWVWVIGAAVFILLLVALLSGGRGRDTVTSDRVTVKKTVERDSGTTDI